MGLNNTMVKKIFLTLFICMILATTLVSAMEFDNIKSVKETKGLAGYNDLEIKNAFGLGKTLWSGTLKYNTQSCGNNCEARTDITLSEDGSLVDDVIFETILEDGSRIEQPIISYKFYIETEVTQIEVPEYETECEIVGYESNGSEIKECITTQIGTEFIDSSEWREYQLGEILPAGDYTLKLEGSKEPSRNVDWIIKSQGEWLEEWAIWGSSTLLDDLISYWKLDESSGNAIDSVGSNDGIVTGAIQGESGKINTAYNFSGGNDYITIGQTDLDITDKNISISAWIKVDSTSANGMIVARDGAGGSNIQYRLWLNNGIPQFDVGSLGAAIADGAITADTWTLITGTSDGSTVKLYINSVLQADTDVAVYEDAGTDTWIGKRVNGFNFDGVMDEVAIWSKGLSQAEVTELYNSDSGSSYPFKASIIINSPENNHVFITNDIEINSTANINGATLVNRTTTIYNSDGSLNQTNITLGLSGTTFTGISTFNLSDGIYNFSDSYCDSDGDCGYSANRTISIDTSNPIIIINLPTPIIDFGSLTANETLNWSIVDSSLDSVWFEYNEINTTLFGAVNETTFQLQPNLFNLTLYANDSLGNTNSSFIAWDYTIFVNNETYSSISYGTSFETFIINLNYNSSMWVLIEGSLWYNNTEYVGTDGNVGDNAIFSTEIQIPTNDAIVNNSFYWTIALTNGTGTTYINTTQHNQTVSPIILQICDITVNTTSINFTLKEAGTFLLLNGSLEATFKYWGSGGDGSIFQEYSFANTTGNNTNYAFCIAPSDANFTTTATISYYTDGYDRREYLLSNYAINNNTQNISLYLASTAATDKFTFTVRDENDDVVPGATIRIQRWDIGTNNFYTVGMIFTTSDGTGIINMRLNDAWYRYQVLYNDILYLTTDPVKESATTRTLDINLAAANPYDQFGLIDFSLTYDEDTNITLFTYADTTGAVQTGCLRVLEVGGLENTEVYFSCVESTSGTLSYEINSSGTYIIRAIFQLNDDFDNVFKVIDEIIRQGTPDRFITIGKFGSVISFLLTGTMAAIGIAAGSLPLGLGLIIASLILENLLGWLNISSAVLYGIISIAILIALNLKRKGA